MRTTILGFNQQMALEYDLSVCDLLVLDYIRRANGSPTMKHIVKDEMALVWISQEKLLEDLPILGISIGTLRNKFVELRKKGLILSETVANENHRGTSTYYTISEVTMSFLSDMLDTSHHEKMIRKPQAHHEKMTSNNKLTYNNKLVYNNNSKELLLENSDEFLGSVKHNKPKKSLYQSCIDLINNFTTNLKLRQVLVEYLKLRLEMDKQLYKNQWKGILNKLKELATDDEQAIELVQQSILKGWANIYPLQKNQSRPSNQFVDNIVSDSRFKTSDDELDIVDEEF